MRPCAAAQSSEASSTADAPSVSGVEFAAVSVPFSLSKAGLKLRDFFEADVLAQIVVAEHAGRRHDEIVEKARIVGRRRPLVASKGELVLIGARDLPFLGHQLAMLPHGEAGARLGVGGRADRNIAQREAAEASLPCRLSVFSVLNFASRLAKERFSSIGGSETVSEPVAMAESIWPIAIFAALPSAACRLVPQAWRQRDAGRVLAKLGADDGFARQVEVLGVRDDRAADHLVDVLAFKLIFLDEAVQRRRHQVEVRQVVITGVAPAKGCAHPADDGHLAQSLLHEMLPLYLRHPGKRLSAYPGS